MATVEKITPKNGKDGHTAVIHGKGFQGATDIVVNFGTAPADMAEVPGNSDINIKVKVPAKNPADPNPVTVKVLIGGAPVGGNALAFEYLGIPAPTLPPPFTAPAEICEGVVATLNGTGFLAASSQGAPTVIVKDATVPGTVNGDTAITFLPPARELAGVVARQEFLLQVSFPGLGTVTAANVTSYPEIG